MTPTASGQRGLPETLPDPLPIDVVDNHVHLDITREGDEPFDVADAIKRARSVGVTRLVQVGCDLDGIRFTMEAIEAHDELVGGIALHPNEVPRLAAIGRLDAAYAEVERCATHDRIRVIGETGLDYFRTGAEGIPVQQDGFRWHIDLAKRLGKALQIHDRDAHADVLRILEEEGAPERTVLHCFSGDLTMARECVERGYHLSFAGTVTFKNARDLRDALTAVAPRPSARRDRRAVPRAGPAPGCDERLVPRARDHPGDGRRAQCRRPDRVPRRVREQRAGLRTMGCGANRANRLAHASSDVQRDGAAVTKI